MKKQLVHILPVFLSLVLLLFAGPASALEESEVILQTDSDWIEAGGASATISVSLTNISCSIDSVKFECLQSETYGDVTAKTVGASPYLTSFSSTKSGTADIQAEVSYSDGSGNTGVIVKTITQKIDHAYPDSISYIGHLSEVTVGEITPVDVRMTDIYGNYVDSKREDDEDPGYLIQKPEYLEFYCSPSDSYLFDGSKYSLNYSEVYVNSEGLLDTSYKVSTAPGTNMLTIVSPYGFKSQYRTIMGISDSEPVSIAVSVSPGNDDPPYLPADGESKFYLQYYLTDIYGNPSGNRTLNITSSNSNYVIGERTSNSYGVINISYGPSFQKGLDILTAYSLDNASLEVETDLMFGSTDPVDMLLTASPEVMPSHDVAPAKTSSIRAKVIDERGNPVKNEVVTFSITDGSYPLYQTADPSLSATTATTDEDGQAIVYFTPGSFIYDTDDPDYEMMGSANCTVNAQWNATLRSILVEWKNYPYLSVETEVNPETVAVNKTVDVTVRLIGDGWALQPDPIDVMLSVDRSGSMLFNNPDRMVELMAAMKVFNAAMAEGRDRVGITSFGTRGTANIYSYTNRYAGNDNSYYDDSWYVPAHYTGNDKYYSDYATLDLSLTTDHTGVDSEIDDIVPVSGTPMRGGIYLAIKELVDNPRTDAVRAVIVLSDGDYNWYGDPLARGYGSTSYATNYGTLTTNYYKFGSLSSDQQDMSEYANANDIKIYSIAFGTGLSSGGIYTLEQLAERTGGTYYSALSGEDLIEVYTDIAGELKTEAGVNTTMNLAFENVEINNVSTPNTGSSILDYVYVYDESTTVEKWNETDTVIEKYTIDDTDDWSEDQSLDFDVGTVRLSETWETTFRLKVLEGGNINIFGPGSTISFNNGTDSLSLPKTYVTAVYNLTVNGTEFKDLLVSNLHSTNAGEITDTLDLEWTLSYTGEGSANQVVYYLREGDDVWIPFQTMTGVPGPLAGDILQDATLVVSDFTPGNYKIRVKASSFDTSDSVVETSGAITLGSHTASYIKIE